ncbi:cation/H(+) antiporter 15-like [Panicum miliaceum]|uniref:Cation/H(+) antiporter 15-like n=1 Tax=Panicum miliaceum TaxID=4540 RepID=A0A3L6T1M7_PANMI|nr:cation/H(+) antiporter 15-like [Panicum miliaceum]
MIPRHRASQNHIFFLLIVLLIGFGFYSDIIGINSFHGPLMLGLAIPELSAARHRSWGEDGSHGVWADPATITMLRHDRAASAPTRGACTGAGCSSSYSSGGLASWSWSVYLEIPLQDAMSPSLFMNSKGIVEVITFTFFLTNKLTGKNTFSVLVCSTVAITAVSVPVPVLACLYDPEPARRRGQAAHVATPQGGCRRAHPRPLACAHDQSHIPGTLALLEGRTPRRRRPPASTSSSSP